MKVHVLSVSISLMTFLAFTGCGDGGGAGSGGAGGHGGHGGHGAAGGGTAGQGGTTTTGEGGNAGHGGGGNAGHGGGQGGANGTWFLTCGDVVCQGVQDDPGTPNCTGQVNGDPCPTLGEVCELAADGCNKTLACATENPDPPPCPISLAAAKHDITYLTDGDRDRVKDQLLTMPLATWKYNHETVTDKDHLGFIIDDQPPSSPAVRPSGERVDLYGYTSMAVAAIQAQHREIESLRREVQSLREELHHARPATCTTPPR